MKLCIASLTLLAVCLTLAAVPAVADVIYSNGPTNGTVDAWAISYGFSVSDTFTSNTIIQGNWGYMFASWLLSPSDGTMTADVQIGTSAFGSDLLDEIVSFSASGCTVNELGYNICMERGTLTGVPAMATGTYWITMSNATTASGDPVYWDENSGPSQAMENILGTIPSESFTLTLNGGTTPEPSGILLFGSGILGLAGALRRKLKT